MRFRQRGAVIESAQLREIVEAIRGFAFVAGGAARGVCLEQVAPRVDDIDVFLRDADGLGECCGSLASLGYRHAMTSETAVSFDARQAGELDVQIIRPYRDARALTYGTPEQVLDHFSFTTEMFALVDGPAVLFGERSLEDTIARRLVLHNVNDQVIVGLRVCKYAAKGYQVTPETMLALFKEWDGADPAWKRSVA